MRPAHPFAAREEQQITRTITDSYQRAFRAADNTDVDAALPTRHVLVDSQGIPDGSQDHSQGDPDTRKVRADATTVSCPGESDGRVGR